MNRNNRNCPVCESVTPELLHENPFSSGFVQKISTCRTCGMCYASETLPANYEEESVYAAAGAVGSGDTKYDREKFRGTVDLLSGYFPSRDISILDIGCAQGGLLSELKSQGYGLAVGMDPSQACVDICTKKGLETFRGKIEGTPGWTYDLVIVSHVLEHVWDVPKALDKIFERVKPGGHLYLEVPDAMRYGDAEFMVCPFLDFNGEHINHFSLPLLTEALTRHGFCPIGSGRRELELWCGAYPAIYAVCSRRSSLKESLQSYIDLSKKRIEALSQKLKPLIADREIVIWGYGEFAQRLFLTDAVKSTRVVQVVDRNATKHGKLFNGVPVESPEKIRWNLPILIASILNADSIQRDCQRLGLSNPILRVD